LLSYDDREYYLRKFLNPYTDVLHKRQYNKQVIDICKKVVECPYWYDRCGVAM
jgi:DNA-directed RNA polymerase